MHRHVNAINLQTGTQSAAGPSHPDEVHDRSADPVITNPTSQETVALSPMFNPMTLKSPFNGDDSDGQAEMDTCFYISSCNASSVTYFQQDIDII